MAVREWWRKWHWEHLALLVAVLLAAALAGGRPGVVADVGRGLTVAALSSIADTEAARGPRGQLRAARIWERLRRYCPHDTEYQLELDRRLGEAYTAGGLRPQAAEVARRLAASGAYEGEPRVALRQARLLVRDGRRPEAVAVLEAALRHGSREANVDHAVRATLAALYDELARHGEAEELLVGLVAAHPQTVELRNNLAYHYAQTSRRLPEAEGLALAAVAATRADWLARLLRPRAWRQTMGVYLDTLGWVYYKQERLDVAQARLEQATQWLAGTPNAEVLCHLAQVYYDRGDDTQAAPLVEQALVLDPQLAEARRLKSLLSGERRPEDQIG